MPIYAYQCSACGHREDVMQKLADAPLSICPKCGAESFTKQVTAAGFALKGSGWYATDFKGGANRLKADRKPAEKKEAAPAHSLRLGRLRRLQLNEVHNVTPIQGGLGRPPFLL